MMEKVLLCMIFGILSAIMLAAAKEVNEEEWRKRSESGDTYWKTYEGPGDRIYIGEPDGSNNI